MSANVPPEDAPISLDPEPAPAPPARRAPQEAEPISLVDAEPAPGESKVKAFASARDTMHVDRSYRRELNVTGQGATRCRVFHSKVAESSLEYMQDQINNWIDSQNIEVKSVGHVMGTMEGKVPTPSVIVIVWY